MNFLIRRRTLVASLAAIILSGCNQPANVVTSTAAESKPKVVYVAAKLDPVYGEPIIPEPDEPRMAPFVRRILDAKIARLNIDDTAVRPWGKTTNLKGIRREIAKWASQIPNDQEVVRLLAYADKYNLDDKFYGAPQDWLTIWYHCKNTVSYFEREGTKTQDVLSGFCALRESEEKHERYHDLASFSAIYTKFRLRDHATHEQTVAAIRQHWEAGNE
jgi:hypothetical protein